MDKNIISYIPQVDYTSRDYVSIRQDLLNLITQYTPQWTSRDPADMGTALVELFSYMGDMLSYYIDRAANEGFLGTASQRSSVLQIANMLGYTPNAAAPATINITASVISSAGSSASVTKGMQFVSSAVVDANNQPIIFEADADTYVGGTVGTSTTFTATQGKTVSSENVGTSNGYPLQTFKLTNTGVISGSVSVLVGTTAYSYVPSVYDYAPYDNVFSTTIDAFGYTYVVFGDGLFGSIPSNGSPVYATYRVGVGAAGNGVSTVTPMTSLPGINFGSSVSSGGYDDETTDSIRYSAPRALKALTRAVSLKDYGYMALQVPGVAKAVADGTSYSSVLIYVSPVGDLGTSDGTTPTAAFTSLTSTIKNYFTDKTPPNTSISVLPPTYVPITANLTVHALPQYPQAAVVSQVDAVLKNLFYTDNAVFAQVVSSHYLLSAINDIPGLDYAVVNALRKTANDQTYSVSAWFRTSNLVTLTYTATGALFTQNQTVIVSGVDPTVDGTYMLTGVTSTTLTFANSGTNVTSTSVSGYAQLAQVDTVTCAVNEVPAWSVPWASGTLALIGVGGI